MQKFIVFSVNETALATALVSRHYSELVRTMLCDQTKWTENGGGWRHMVEDDEMALGAERIPL